MSQVPGVNEDVFKTYIQDLANMNNVTIKEVEETYDALYYIFDTLSQLDLELSPRQLREIWLTYWQGGLEEVKSCIRALLQQ